MSIPIISTLRVPPPPPEILAFTLGKSLRRFKKDNNYLEKFDAYETFANDKRIRQWTMAFNTIYLCMYIFKTGVFKDFRVGLLQSKI